MIIKLRAERRGSHIHERVFMGEDEDHLQLTGTLIMDVGQWQLFGAALLLGASHTHGRLKVIVPDDRTIVEQSTI